MREKGARRIGRRNECIIIPSNGGSSDLFNDRRNYVWTYLHYRKHHLGRDRKDERHYMLFEKPRSLIFLLHPTLNKSRLISHFCHIAFTIATLCNFHIMHYVEQSWELYIFNVKNMHDESTEEKLQFLSSRQSWRSEFENFNFGNQSKLTLEINRRYASCKWLKKNSLCRYYKRDRYYATSNANPREIKGDVWLMTVIILTTAFLYTMHEWVMH